MPTGLDPASATTPSVLSLRERYVYPSSLSVDPAVISFSDKEPNQSSNYVSLSAKIDATPSRLKNKGYFWRQKP